MKNHSHHDLDKLKQQRRLNVQEQVALRKASIYAEAIYWRENGLPAPLASILQEKGIDLERSIILDYEQDSPGRSTDEGIVLTPEGRFWEFEADLDEKRESVLELYGLTDISDRYEIAEHKKGIGQTDGFLAMEVLRELNQ